MVYTNPNSQKKLPFALGYVAGNNRDGGIGKSVVAMLILPLIVPMPDKICHN